MWKAKVIKIPTNGHWIAKHKLGDFVEVADYRLKYLEKQGYLKGIEHYRVERMYETCKTCGHRITKKKKFIIITTEKEVKEDGNNNNSPGHFT